MQRKRFGQPKKLLSLFLVLCLMLGMLPVMTSTARAENTEGEQTKVSVGSQTIQSFFSG